jgi:hypothetical protein
MLLPSDGPDHLQAQGIGPRQVHDTDLPWLCSQMNRQYFNGQLPSYVSVCCAALVANKDYASRDGDDGRGHGIPPYSLGSQ